MSELVLRTCSRDLTSYNGFVWPESGYVECSDWNPEPICGGGLHGLLRGEGEGGLLNAFGLWQVVEINEWVGLGGKVKFPRGNVIFTGEKEEALKLIKERYPSAAVVFDVSTGNRGSAISGDFGTSIAGHRGSAISGGYGIAAAGDCGTAAAGHKGSATAGDNGTATAGYKGTATAGYKGAATAGDYGVATAGDYGAATAGDYGVATTGYNGSATAGESGIIQIMYYDSGCRVRIKTGYVGEDGIKPDTAYNVVDGKFVEVS